MIVIKDIRGRMIIDSRGNPTVEADVILSNGLVGRAAVPSGASTGSKEAIELRDQDKNFYLGKSVNQAIANINTKIKQALINKEPENQKNIDQVMIELDGTENKSNLGANAILAVSMAVAHAAAKSQDTYLYEYFNANQQLSLPTPMMNIINGGAHADNNIDIQEFMIIPAGRPSFSEAVRCGAEIFHALHKNLTQKNWLPLSETKEALHQTLAPMRLR